MSLSSVPDLSEHPWGTVHFLSPRADWPGQHDNFVRTTRYTLLTFIPLTLFENFRLATNIYFLLNVIFSWLPDSPISFLFTFVPLLVVLLISMIKSGIEDLLKHNEDQRRNSAPVKIFRDGDWIDSLSKDVRAGDLIRQNGDSMIVCDMIYLTSSSANQTIHYSEVQLNGESAVKTMSPHRAFKTTQSPEFFAQFSVELPEPNRDLTRFHGKLYGPNHETHSISIENVLLRAMTVHCTEWFMGVAVMTGHDTKVMKNRSHPPSKRTMFDKRINLTIIGVFCFKLCCILPLSGATAVFERDGSMPYIESVTKSIGSSFFVALLQYFVLYSYLIPISLIVTVEIIRLFHMFVILWDHLLIDPEFGGAYPHNSNVTTQLGVVTHVLSDKTGTLTENIMELVAFTDATGAHRAKEFKECDVDSSIDFLMCLAICNTVIVYHGPNGSAAYNAESPDEAAFVEFAARYGVVLVDRQLEEISLRIRGEMRHLEIVALIPFTSERKRMTIVVAEGEILSVYSKGADVVMFDRAIEPHFEDDVKNYAMEGLRTLVFGKRIIPTDSAAQWRADWHTAASSITNRDAAIAGMALTIECDLEIIGLSAVEDRLQPHVREAIQWIRDAGLRLWVLTGDKLETAVEIGRTSAVISTDSEMMVVAQETEDSIRAQLNAYRVRFEEGDEIINPVLILTAHATELVLTTESDLFLKLAKRILPQRYL
jgi:magnesium-transporting ATPase (P-type)